MQLKTCCGCFSLRTGTLFAGVSSIVLSIIMIIVIFTVPRLVIKMMVLDALGKDVVNIILTVNLCMTIIISAFLIAGTLKKKTVMMLPWVILGIMLLIGALISVFYTAIRFIIDHKEHRDNLANGIILLVLGPIVILIYTYFWFVAYSHFQQLRSEKNSGRIGPYGRPYNYRRA
ncbi:uncharacterized protein [Venturia canescens]|uniref:uncharacterized protein n=1 Tax=Venturia canescens TaxID=32260 RepID=UPI001C9BF836|nr:uncharacterized protein LOC122415864 [Venturia canescens]XP_043284339.1 uncharacterized protein LOC122415864 [Venturia canescens]